MSKKANWMTGLITVTVSMEAAGAVAAAANLQAFRALATPSSAVEYAKCRTACLKWEYYNSKDPSKNFYGVKTNGQYQLVKKRRCTVSGTVCDGEGRSGR